ncbi:MAG TPA: hypothetical protein VIK91_13345 [Nannocystis sp.]
MAMPLAVPDLAVAQGPTAAATTPAPDVSTPAEPPPPSPAAPVPAPEGPAPAPPPAAISATMQTILDGMKGQEAVVFARGGTVTGRIIAVDGASVLMVDYEHEGKIAMIPKADVLEVRGRVRKRIPPGMPDGTGSLAAGGVLVGLGGPLMLSGLVFFGLGPGDLQFVYLPQIIPAVILLGGGIPLLVRGTRQRRAYQAAQSELTARLTPTFGPTRGGFSGGLTLRF